MVSKCNVGNDIFEWTIPLKLNQFGKTSQTEEKISKIWYQSYQSTIIIMS